MERREVKDVIQQYYHWLELISKYETLSGEKITDRVKITLALQKVRGTLAQSLNVSVSDLRGHRFIPFSSTTPITHQWTKEASIRSPQTRRRRSMLLRERQRPEIKRTSKRRGSTGSSSGFQSQKGKSKGKGKTRSKTKGKGQWTTCSWHQNQNQNWNQSDQTGHKGKNGKGKWFVRCVVNRVIRRISVGGISHRHRAVRLAHHSRHIIAHHSRHIRIRILGVRAISQSILRITQFRLFNQISLEAFKTSDSLLNNSHKSQIVAFLQVTMGQ